MNNTVFIITSAHHYLYIYEAVKKFHQNENNILYFMNFQDENEYLALKKILLDINWTEIIEIPLYKYKSLLSRYIQYRQLIRNLKKLKITSLYMSQYGPSYSYLILNSVKAEKKIITDDGQALILFSQIRKENLRREKSNVSKFKNILYKMYEPKQLTFFTTNNIDIVKPDKIIKNNLDYLGNHFSQKEKNNVILFLGSPFVSKNMMSQQKYIALLNETFSLYNKQKIIYYPHRAENVNELNIISDHFKYIDIRVSSIPIEFYLMTELHPKKVISFYSGAIPNLISLFKKSINIDSIKIPQGYFHSEKSLDIANSVYKEYTSLVADNFKIIELPNH